MKKSLFAISLMYLFISTTTKAQDSVMVASPEPARAYHIVEFGARFMPTFSSFEMETSSGGTIKGQVTLGYGIGGLLAFNLSNHVGIQGELIYNSLSQKYVDQELEREINIRFVNIPLLLSLNTGKSNPVNLNIVFGPQLGLNVGSSIKATSGSTSDTLTTVLALKKGDFSFTYGAGLQFALNSTGTVALDLGYRGVYGFVDITNTSQTSDENTYYILGRAKVRTQSGYVGFTFLF